VRGSSFAAIRTLVSAIGGNATIGDLEEICDEARAARVARAHAPLAAWLVCWHTFPISLALIFAGCGSCSDGAALLGEKVARTADNQENWRSGST